MNGFKLALGTYGARVYLDSDSIATGVSITWGRAAIHSAPEKRTLTATVAIDPDKIALLRGLPYQPLRAQLAETVLFSGVVTAATITAGTPGKPFIVTLKAVEVPNELNGKYLKGTENFYTLNGQTTTKSFLKDVEENYNLNQTWLVRLPVLPLPALDRVQVFDSKDTGVPSWSPLDAMEVALAQHPLLYPTHTPDFREWLLCNRITADSREVVSLDGTKVGGTTAIAFSTADVPTSINPFGGGFFVGSKDIRRDGDPTPEYWVYPALAMFGSHAPADEDLRFAQPTTPDYNGLNVFASDYRCRQVRNNLAQLYSLQATPPRTFTLDSRLDKSLPAKVWNTWEQPVDYYVSHDTAAEVYDATPIYRPIGGRLTVTAESLRHDLTMMYSLPQRLIPAGARWRDVDPATRWSELPDSQATHPYTWSTL